MLASTLKLITQRAETVSTAKQAADQAGLSVGNRQIPLASAIAAGQLWRDAQLDMIASTISYNQAISDFVLTLEPNRSPEQLTAFMLGTPKTGAQQGSTSPQNQTNRSAANQQGFPTNRQQFRKFYLVATCSAWRCFSAWLSDCTPLLVQRNASRQNI